MGKQKVSKKKTKTFFQIMALKQKQNPPLSPQLKCDKQSGEREGKSRCPGKFWVLFLFVKKHYLLCKLGKMGKEMFSSLGWFLPLVLLKTCGRCTCFYRVTGKGLGGEVAKFWSFLSSSFPIFAITVAFQLKISMAFSYNMPLRFGKCSVAASCVSSFTSHPPSPTSDQSSEGLLQLSGRHVSHRSLLLFFVSLFYFLFYF